MMDERPVTLFSTLATRKALDDEPACCVHRATGADLDLVYDPTVGLARRLRAGERADVIVAVTAALQDLAEEGLVDSASVVPLARTRVGVAVAPGASPPDLSSVTEFVEAMTSARSVAYSETGASGIYLRDVLARLGVLEEVASRATVLRAGFTGTAIVDGRADLAVQQLSELAFVEGIEIVGPLPVEIDHVTEFSGALVAGATADQRARNTLAFLASQDARQPYRRSKLEPV